MSNEGSGLDAIIVDAKAKFEAVRREIEKVIVGQSNLIEKMLIACLTNGHILLEGVPGLAKTLAVKTFAKTISCDFKRVQFTPDLLPADLTGTSIYNPKDGVFSIRKGPIFTNILLGDEINRAPAKVQSALLEVMQEKQVTIQGETFQTGSPYLVMATQNPLEHEGTYPLPEAQTDRFMLKVVLDYPTKEEEKKILDRMGKISGFPEVSPVIDEQAVLDARRYVNEIYLDEKLIDYLLEIVLATRDAKNRCADIEGLLQFGASPRGTIFLKQAAQARAFLSGRSYVAPEDVKSVAHDVLCHRLRTSYEAEAEGITSRDIIDRILDAIPVP